jgi:hypothetical protein
MKFLSVSSGQLATIMNYFWMVKYGVSIYWPVRLAGKSHLYGDDDFWYTGSG